MIDLDRGLIVRGGQTIRIASFEVWWKTPFGLCQNVHEAKEIMDKNELPMQLAVQPVPVALGESPGSYEAFLQ